MARARSWLVLIALLAVLAAGAWLGFRRPSTPPLPGGVAALDTVSLGGDEQWVLARGRSDANQVLLFLHGGPGTPLMYLAHAFQRELEESFVVVHWDQRGAGKSFRSDIPAGAMTTTRLLTDARELAEQLRQRFGGRRILVVGHGWGGLLGMVLAQRHPELVRCYVGVGQVGSLRHVEEMQDRFIRAQAELLGERKALENMDRLGGTVREKWLFRFGGELRDATSSWDLLRLGFKAPEYSPLDLLRISWGADFTRRTLRQDLFDGELADAVPAVTVPVYFFAGRYDQVVPPETSAAYFDRLRAPRKRWVWFEQSAHYPFLEEPARFAAEMRLVGEECAAVGR
jgi:pimeloyl-ACP methyl ester carboxylesterase